MDYISVKIPKAILYLTAEEIHRLVLQDSELFCLALKRGKYINRHQEQKSRERAKWASHEGDKLKDI